jgi:hypothetical protein
MSRSPLTTRRKASTDGQQANRKAAPAVAAGAAVGAAMTYFMDPDRGRRRRALVRDKVVHAAHETADESQAAARDTRNRAQGLVARVQQPFQPEPTGQQLAERVRAELGRWCSHPSAVDVEADDDGNVAITGAILRSEADQVRMALARVRGVRRVEDRLQEHESGADVPELQGAGRRPGARPRFRMEVWSPSARMLAMAGAGTAALWGARRGGLMGTAAVAGGSVVATRAWTSRRLAPIAGRLRQT